jgi:hypothetical protein
MATFKIGSKVKIIDFSDLPNDVKKKLKTKKIHTVKSINRDTGGLRFKGMVLGTNIFGIEQGLVPERCKLVFKNPKSKIRNPKS